MNNNSGNSSSNWYLVVLMLMTLLLCQYHISLSISQQTIPDDERIQYGLPKPQNQSLCESYAGSNQNTRFICSNDTFDGQYRIVEIYSFLEPYENRDGANSSSSSLTSLKLTALKTFTLVRSGTTVEYLNGNNIQNFSSKLPDTLGYLNIENNPNFTGPIPDWFCRLHVLSIRDTLISSVPDCYWCYKGITLSSDLLKPHNFSCLVTISNKDNLLVTNRKNIATITVDNSIECTNLINTASNQFQCTTPHLSNGDHQLIVSNSYVESQVPFTFYSLAYLCEQSTN
ncbi:hypothetical protein DFA_11264 [Cavenderia fasciculata]|uniref:Uncharacterized protein n=1 Tax=Cavenderia fasciculata TaxID=261658 RepID=F4QFQ0_CACFS|nr:uncharacterized protein DFA_11264 [Cavenderia fasciculata]EGG13503.1 hypothetical protein DFA_11264 [Cavenderia fasciculata]|eukprot:XP_004350207.1 hypothetical protein DFA_11264 [Cavenderia fasciculata]